ncbi:MULTISPECIES: CoA transferase subunit A [Priestia]|uniref:CoA transferase subunit A n=1 Tax=Priestia TaxID=2800373 RepID=UPI0003F958CF|nr:MULTISPECIES: CoA transferase subunit A [Priestia]MBK0008381.1 CoA transferase subunit A [Bacillus sp. S35]MCM3251365.1 CoA transferase subunit A [Priestia aryabhattai]MCM3643115.1 CoA transferase subunit A [Priestia aryabhattai]PFW74083.1 acyl CoA:acetate/3-ketoacid CoA transferase subunit alpha [Priestia aryabhattai]
MTKVENSFQKMKTVEQAIEYVDHAATLMIGGFGGVGSPPSLIDGLIESGKSNFTLICNDSGFPHIGAGKLVSQGRIQKLIASHIGSNPVAGTLMTEEKLKVEFSPQGTLAERIRAGGVGLGGVLIDVGIENDIIQFGKEKVEIDGKTFLVEKPLTADVAFVYAKKADPFGNLLYDKSARNTNPLMAMAGRITIAEVDEIVPLGDIDPENVMTSGVFVNYIVPSKGVNWKWVWE